jgi:hypothetical protein
MRLRALGRAGAFLAGHGYVAVHRTLTTLMTERRDPEGPTWGGRAPKVVVVAVPQPDGGEPSR